MRALIVAVTLLAVFAVLAPVLLLNREPGRPQHRGSYLARFFAGLRFRWQLARLTGDAGNLFFRRGKSSWYWVTTIADTAEPTPTEVNAGVRLDKAIADSSGWETQLNRLNEPWWDSNTDIQTDGPQQLGDAQFVFFDDDGTGSDANSVARQAVDTLMVEGLAGYAVLLPKKKGAAANTDDAIIFPAKLGARNPDLTMTVQSARYVCQFAITGTPIKDAVVTT